MQGFGGYMNLFSVLVNTICINLCICIVTLSALMLLVGQQEGYLVFKKLSGMLA